MTLDQDLRRGADWARGQVNAVPVDPAAAGRRTARRRVRQGVLGCAAAALGTVGFVSTLAEPGPVEVAVQPPQPEHVVCAVPATSAGERTSPGGATVASGTVGSVPWHFSVQGEPPVVKEGLVVGGRRVSGGESNGDSWRALVENGYLTWSVSYDDSGVFVDGQVPATVSRVLVHLDDGSVVETCTAGLHLGLPIGWFAAGFDPGRRVDRIAAEDSLGHLVARVEKSQLTPRPGGTAHMVPVDRSLGLLPLGGAPAPAYEPLANALAAPVVASGTAGGEPWSLRVGGTPSEITVYFSSAGGGGGVRHDRETLGGTLARRRLDWGFDVARGQVVLWGEVPRSTEVVRVDMTDGTSVVLDPVDANPEHPFVYFAGALPPGGEPVSVAALDAQGTTVGRLNPERQEDLDRVDSDLPGSGFSGDVATSSVPLGDGG